VAGQLGDRDVLTTGVGPAEDGERTGVLRHQVDAVERSP
jgi:hypothetical protein